LTISIVTTLTAVVIVSYKTKHKLGLRSTVENWQWCWY